MWTGRTAYRHEVRSKAWPAVYEGESKLTSGMVEQASLFKDADTLIANALIQRRNWKNDRPDFD